ncbi:MAG: hypothetical protein GY705_03715 [Bacteroidetes bacterium]|nr:hypothetical protein [Bacteroidota bacterium]
MKNNLYNLEIFPFPDSNKILEICEGNNRKHLLIVTNNRIEQPHKKLLEKILQSIHYDLKEDVLFIQLEPEQNFHFTSLAKRKKIKNVLFFGLTPGNAGLNFQYALYSPVRHKEKTYIFVDGLEKIESQQALKKKLWGVLQGTFLAK